MKPVAITLLCMSATVCCLLALLSVFLGNFWPAIGWVVGGIALLALMEWLAWRATR